MNAFSCALVTSVAGKVAASCALHGTANAAKTKPNTIRRMTTPLAWAKTSRSARYGGYYLGPRQVQRGDSNRHFKIRLRPVHPDLQEAIDFHHAIIEEGSKALVGYDTAKALANVVLMSEIPTTYDKDEQRQVNAGNLLLRGVPGVGKTFFGVILAAISDAKFARLQGREI